MNTIYLGDCLNVLRESVPDESVDLVYIDPPFNSKRDYNIFFDDKEIQTQRIAFEDTWTLKNITDSLAELHTLKTDNLYFLLLTYQKVAPHAFPYLTMMSLRILELHRVLKPTGSFYLHCDPTMSHYLKTACDIIFGEKNYRNEISWKRSNPKSHTTNNIPNCRDIILRYTKSDNFIFNKVFQPLGDDYVEKAYRYKDNNGKKYRLLPLLNPNDNRPNLTYEFLGVTRVWRWTKERMQKAYKEGLVVQIKKGAVPQYKKYLEGIQREELLLTIGVILTKLVVMNLLATQHKNQKHC
jgi:adenine specific DNA methylase Mod